MIGHSTVDLLFANVVWLNVKCRFMESPQLDNLYRYKSNSCMDTIIPCGSCCCVWGVIQSARYLACNRVDITFKFFVSDKACDELYDTGYRTFAHTIVRLYLTFCHQILLYKIFCVSHYFSVGMVVSSSSILWNDRNKRWEKLGQGFVVYFTTTWIVESCIFCSSAFVAT